MNNAVNKDELRIEMIGYLAKQINIPAENLNTSDDLKDLGLDSFRIIQLVLFLERRFKLVITDDAYTPENLKSIDSILNALPGLKI